jgi:uncharacterized membrane protein
MKLHKVALALAAAIGAAETSAIAGETENCYGVSLKGQNDCAAARHSCAGQATIDYDGASWKAVPKGTCTSLKTPFGPGALAEIKRPA